MAIHLDNLPIETIHPYPSLLFVPKVGRPLFFGEVQPKRAIAWIILVSWQKQAFWTYDP